MRGTMRYPAGSTPSYTPEIAQRILDGLEACGSLRKVLMSDPELPARRTVERWISEDVEGFAARYARSKNIGLDNFVEETLEIADEPPTLTAQGSIDSGAIAHAKVRIETRRWLAERMAPQRYGLKQGMELSGPNGQAIPPQILVVTGVPHADINPEDIA